VNRAEYRTPSGGSELGRTVDQAEHELVWMPRLDSIRGELAVRKVTQIARHDDLRGAADRSREHVAVVGIRKFERAHKGLVSRDETVGDRGVHEAARPVENGGIEVWTRCKDAALLSSFINRCACSKYGTSRGGTLASSGMTRFVPFALRKPARSRTTTPSLCLPVESASLPARARG
jgi:hypothetical protein